MADNSQTAIILEDALGNKKQVSLNDIEDEQTRNSVAAMLENPHLKLSKIVIRYKAPNKD